MRRINENHLSVFNTEQCHLWLAFWCDFYGAVMVLATCLLSVAYKEDVGPAAVGLAISNTIQVRELRMPVRLRWDNRTVYPLHMSCAYWGSCYHCSQLLTG